MNGHANPPLSRLLNVITLLETAVLLVAGGLLYFLPSLAASIWPWTLTPFNTRFIGAMYLASLAAIIILARRNQWSPGRVLLLLIFTFTALVLILSLLYLNSELDPAKWSTWVWLALYVLLPVNSGYHLLKYRGLPPAETTELAPAVRTILLVQSVLAGAYGLALLALPAQAAGFWPWPLNPFHAQLYSGIFIAVAAGSLLLVRSASSIELFTLGLAQALFGGLALLGLIMVDVAVKKVNWAAGNTWLWVALCVIGAAVGLVYIVMSRRQVPQPVVSRV